MGQEQNWLLLIPRVNRAQSDWRAITTIGCPRWHSQAKYILIGKAALTPIGIDVQEYDHSHNSHTGDLGLVLQLTDVL
jgi:hypothetical protein